MSSIDGNKPHINAIHSPQRTPRTQNVAIPFFDHWYEKILRQQYRTRMTRIQRIPTDIFNPCQSMLSVQSVFHQLFDPLFITEFAVRRL